MFVRALQRALSTTSLAVMEGQRGFCTSRCNKRGGKVSGSTAEEEDKEELERERRLREQFAKKIEQAMPHYARQKSGNCGVGNCGASPSDSSARFFRFMFFTTSLFFLLAFMQLSDANSAYNVMQNIPWWQLPVSTASHFILMRVLLPFREQRRIKKEYEAASRLAPSLTLDQFFVQRYPRIFQGYRTQQQEVAAAIAACIAASGNLKFVDSVLRAAGSARDTQAAVDNIIDALRRDYPHIFQGGGAPPHPSLLPS